MKNLELENALRGQFILQVSSERNAQKESLRETLEAEVAKFVKRGGKVVEIPLPEQKPRQASKRIQPYPSRKPQSKPYYDFKYNKQLRDWCNEAKGRAKKLGALVGYSDTWISHRCHGTTQVTLSDMAELQTTMNTIELAENAERLSEIVKKHTGSPS